MPSFRAARMLVFKLPRAFKSQIMIITTIIIDSNNAIMFAIYSFENRLYEMFTDIGTFYRELEGKLKTEQLKVSFF